MDQPWELCINCILILLYLENSMQSIFKTQEILKSFRSVWFNCRLLCFLRFKWILIGLYLVQTLKKNEKITVWLCILQARYLSHRLHRCFYCLGIKTLLDRSRQALRMNYYSCSVCVDIHTYMYPYIIIEPLYLLVGWDIELIKSAILYGIQRCAVRLGAPFACGLR